MAKYYSQLFGYTIVFALNKLKEAPWKGKILYSQKTQNGRKKQYHVLFSGHSLLVGTLVLPLQR
jgi:hypothetical protein